VDCALAEITPGAATRLGSLTALPVPPAVPGPGTRVFKIGRTTGKTFGTICFGDWGGFLDLSFGTFYFENFIGVIGDPSLPFAAPGDSGAMVISLPDGDGVGLVVARSYCSGAFPRNPAVPSLPSFIGYIVLICPLPAVRDALAAQLGVQPTDITFKT
jgi:hypothetical protein